jgi:hypothetical protein
MTFEDCFNSAFYLAFLLLRGMFYFGGGINAIGIGASLESME